MKWKNVKMVLVDWRLWVLPLVMTTLRIMDSVSGVGDYTKLLSRTSNMSALIVVALSVFLFTGPLADVSFYPDKEWEELWDQGGLQAIGVALIFVGRFFFAGVLGVALINPLFS